MYMIRTGINRYYLMISLGDYRTKVWKTKNFGTESLTQKESKKFKFEKLKFDFGIKHSFAFQRIETSETYQKETLNSEK